MESCLTNGKRPKESPKIHGQRSRTIFCEISSKLRVPKTGPLYRHTSLSAVASNVEKDGTIIWEPELTKVHGHQRKNGWYFWEFTHMARDGQWSQKCSKAGRKTVSKIFGTASLSPRLQPFRKEWNKSFVSTNLKNIHCQSLKWNYSIK